MSKEVKVKGKKKILIAVVVIVVIVAIIIGNAIRNMGTQTGIAVNTVEIEPVQYRDLSDTISLKGTISGVSITNVTSIATAEVTAVNVQVGDIVAEGDLLITLDTESIESQIADTQSSITNATAIASNNAKKTVQTVAEAQADQATTLSRAQDAINKAQTEYDDVQKKMNQCASDLASKRSARSEAEAAMNTNATRLAELKARGASDSEIANQTEAYQQTVTNFNKVDGEVTTLEAQYEGYVGSLKSAQSVLDNANISYTDAVTSTGRSVQAAQNAADMSKYQSNDASSLKDQLDNLQKQLEDCNLSAPQGGVVTAVNVKTGDKYTAGTTMITIEDTSALKVVVSVDEADILKIQEGMKAVVNTDATAEEEISGTVTRVVRVKNQSAAGDTSAAGYSAEISIDNTQLLVGMSAKARIMLKEKANVLAVPYDLIQYDASGEAFVLVAEINSDGTATAVRKNIKVGEEVNYYTEITGGDLKEGDQLIYDYTFSVVEGQTFTPDQMYSGQDLIMDGGAVLEAE